MMFAFGEVAFGELPALHDQSVADPFAALLRTSNPHLVYLVEMFPYDTSPAQTLMAPLPFGAGAFGEPDITYYGAVVAVYLSDEGFVTEPDDAIASHYFEARLDNPLQYETSILTGQEFGSGNQSYGALVILNGDGQLDALNDYFWSSRRVVIKAGARNFRYAEFATVFDGAANGIEVDDERITITIRDNRVKIDQYLAPGTYAGTGGLEGGADLQGKVKPLCYGVVNNVEPVLVNAASLIYQLHDGAINYITAVRDSGVPLANGGDVADILAAPVGAGFFITDLSGGYIKLGSTPAGRITLDALGESGNGGYVSTTGDIIERIVKTRLGVFSLSNAEVDTGSLNRVSAAVPGAVGLFINERVTASSLIESFLQPIGAFWSYSRQGLLTAGVIKQPSAEIYTITADDIDDPGVKILSTIAPAWRISVGYAPATVVQSADELADGTTATDRAYATQQYRYVTHQDELVRTRDIHAVERVFQTQLADQAEATALLDRLMSVYGQRRRVYQVPLHNTMFRLYIGDQVKLVYDRYGLSAGANLMVVGIAEDAETGLTTLQLWG